MTDSPAPPPSNNKKPPVFAYRGSDPKYQNVFFYLLNSDFQDGNEWQTGGEKMIFVHSLDREIQPDNVRNRFCEYSLGSAHDLNDVKVSEEGFGGILGMFSQEQFAKNFVRLGKK